MSYLILRRNTKTQKNNIQITDSTSNKEDFVISCLTQFKELNRTLYDEISLPVSKIDQLIEGLLLVKNTYNDKKLETNKA